MATPDSFGTSKCGNPVCGRVVYVRKNSGGFVYYRCEACTFEGRFHAHRHGEAFVKSAVVLEVVGPDLTPQKAAPVAPVSAAAYPSGVHAKVAHEKTKAAPGSLAALMEG